MNNVSQKDHEINLGSKAVGNVSADVSKQALKLEQERNSSA